MNSYLIATATRGTVSKAKKARLESHRGGTMVVSMEMHVKGDFMNTKPVSDAKASANRRNATKSTGPTNTSSTRFNAVRHGLLSAGITELDDADGYQDTLRRLNEAYLDEVDKFLVGQIALYMVRLRRTARLEAEFITGVLNPPIYGDEDALQVFVRPVLDPGIPASMSSSAVQALVSTYQRYESANENKLYRAMNQLERIRRIRQGEQLPAPAALDVGVHYPRTDSAETVPNLVDEASPFEAVHSSHEGLTEDASVNDTSEQSSSQAGQLITPTEEPE